jgi:signal transduction histidine kinase
MGMTWVTRVRRTAWHTPRAWDRAQALLRGMSLARRFRLASFLILIVGLIGIGAWIERQIEAGIIHGTASTTALYVQSFVAPELGELADGKPVSQPHIQTLARLLQDSPMGQQIVSFKLWGPNGFVLYDTDQTSIGHSFTVEPRLAQAWQGQTTSRISDLESDENVAERQISKQLLETYSPVRLGNSDRIVAVAEFYQRVDELQSDIAIAQRRSWLVVAGAMLVMYLLLSGFVQRTSDTIDRQQAELTDQVSRLKALLAQNEELHERVQGSAAQTAAINERFLRRISAELHDGPAQEISLALLRIDPGGGELGSDDDNAARLDAPRELDTIRGALRHALAELRAISSGLGLPELERVSLPEVVQRAVRAHERRTGTRVATELERLPAYAPPAVKIAVYRVIQEALNNSYRHAGAVGQEVRVRCEGRQLRVEVSDRGPGFSSRLTSSGGEHFGLLGMRERVQSLGGVFQVESEMGHGTRVIACLALDAQEKA